MAESRVDKVVDGEASTGPTLETASLTAGTGPIEGEAVLGMLGEGDNETGADTEAPPDAGAAIRSHPRGLPSKVV